MKKHLTLLSVSLSFFSRNKINSKEKSLIASCFSLNRHVSCLLLLVWFFLYFVYQIQLHYIYIYIYIYVCIYKRLVTVSSHRNSQRRDISHVQFESSFLRFNFHSIATSICIKTRRNRCFT